jgi:hypothetical protein
VRVNWLAPSVTVSRGNCPLVTHSQLRETRVGRRTPLPGFVALLNGTRPPGATALQAAKRPCRHMVGNYQVSGHSSTSGDNN